MSASPPTSPQTPTPTSDPASEVLKAEVQKIISKVDKVFQNALRGDLYKVVCYMEASPNKPAYGYQPLHLKEFFLNTPLPQIHNLGVLDAKNLDEIVRVHFEVPLRTSEHVVVPRSIDDLISSISHGLLIRHRSAGELQTLQDERMGAFSPQKLLPVVKLNTYKVDLRLLEDFEGEENDTNSPLSQLYRYLEDDRVDRSSNMPILMTGPSGCGKTWTVMQAATKYFVVFLDCTAPYYEDRNYAALVTQVQAMYTGCIGANITDWHSNKKGLVLARVQIELLARYLLLRILLSYNPGLTPTEFRNYQLNGGADVIAELVARLRNVTPLTNSAWIGELGEWFKLKNIHMVLAIDEASSALSTCGNFIVSETALAENVRILTTRNEVFVEHQRGLFGVLVEAALAFSGSIIAISPCVDIRFPTVLNSGLGKKKLRVVGGFKPKEPYKTDAYLDHTVNLHRSGFTMSQSRKRMFYSRHRWPEVLAHEISRSEHRTSNSGLFGAQIKSQQQFDDVVDQVITENKAQLKFDIFSANLSLLCNLVRAGIQRALFYEVLLEQEDPSGQEQGMALHARIAEQEAYWSAWLPYTPAEHRFIATSNFFVDAKERWCISEPIALAAAIEYLEKVGVTPGLYASFFTLRNNLETLGKGTTAKGLPLRRLVIETIASTWHGKTISEVLQNFGFTKLPVWGASKIDIKAVGTIQEFVHTSGSYKLCFPQPASIITHPVPGYLIFPPDSLRADGILYITPERPLLVGSTFSKTAISYAAKNLDQLESTNVRFAFTKEGHTVHAGVNQRASASTTFWKSRNCGIRLMVVLPGVSESSFRAKLPGHASCGEFGTVPKQERGEGESESESEGESDAYSTVIPPPWSHYDENTDSYVIYITARTMHKFFDKNMCQLLEFTFGAVSNCADPANFTAGDLDQTADSQVTQSQSSTQPMDSQLDIASMDAESTFAGSPPSMAD